MAKRNVSINYSARNLWAGFLFGLGIAAFFDETVFHQLLHWHHFYDKSTTNIGLVSDGLFHAFSWFATIGGLFLFADLRRRNTYNWKRWGGWGFSRCRWISAIRWYNSAQAHANSPNSLR